ncbi:hypothetical protein ACWEN6_03030 [Sphaerisporangium sp. NPDC004334]
MTVPTLTCEGAAPGVVVRTYRYAICGNLPGLDPARDGECVKRPLAARRDVPREVVEEMRRVHLLRNRLVEIWRAYDAQLEAIWLRYPEVRAAQERIDALKVAVEAARAQGVSAEETSMVRKELKEAIERLKLVKRGVYPVIKILRAEAKSAYTAAVAGTYREFAQDGGLYWGTYKDLLWSRHMPMVRKVSDQRKAGRKAQLRFRRWDGTERLAVVLQITSTSQRPRDPETLADAEGPWRNVFGLSPWIAPQTWQSMSRAEQRRATRGAVARFRIGSGPATAVVTLPVRIHRMLPAEATVVEAHLTRAKVTDGFECHLSVTVHLPAPGALVGGGRVAVHLGWRSLADGGLRVAVVAGAGRVPDALAGVVRDRGAWHEVVLPREWRARYERLAGVDSTRRLGFNAMRDWLVRWLASDGERRELLELAAGGSLEDLAQWRSPDRLRRVVAGLRCHFHVERHDAGPVTDVWDGAPQVTEAALRLIAWDRQDLHLHRWHGHGTAKVLGQRNDWWRQVASWVTRQAAVVVLDGWNLTDLAQRPGPGPENAQTRVANANRFMAAPGELRRYIEEAAERQGGAVEKTEFESSLPHIGCGGLLDGDKRKSAVMVGCAACGQVVDQDVNTLEHMMRA